MVKVIFEEETEVGLCDYEGAAASSFKYAEPDFAALYAHTQASVNGRSGVLRIEQRCYLRHGDDVPDQTWVAPKMSLEPAAMSEEEMASLAQQMHRQYVQEARGKIPARFLA